MDKMLETLLSRIDFLERKAEAAPNDPPADPHTSTQPRGPASGQTGGDVQRLGSKPTLPVAHAARGGAAVEEGPPLPLPRSSRSRTQARPQRGDPTSSPTHDEHPTARVEVEGNPSPPGSSCSRTRPRSQGSSRVDTEDEASSTDSPARFGASPADPPPTEPVFDTDTESDAGARVDGDGAETALPPGDAGASLSAPAPNADLAATLAGCGPTAPPTMLPELVVDKTLHQELDALLADDWLVAGHSPAKDEDAAVGSPNDAQARREARMASINERIEKMRASNSNDGGSGVDLMAKKPRWRWEGLGEEPPCPELVMRGSSLWRSAALAVAFVAVAGVKLRKRQLDNKPHDEKACGNALRLFVEQYCAWVAGAVRLPVAGCVTKPGLKLSEGLRGRGVFSKNLRSAIFLGGLRARPAAKRHEQPALQLKVYTRSLVTRLCQQPPPEPLVGFMQALCRDGFFFPADFLWRVERDALEFNPAGATRWMEAPAPPSGKAEAAAAADAPRPDEEAPPRFRLVLAHLLITRLVVVGVVLQPWSCGLVGTRARADRSALLNLQCLATALFLVLARAVPEAVPPVFPAPARSAATGDGNGGSAGLFWSAEEVAAALLPPAEFEAMRVSMEPWLDEAAQELRTWLDALVSRVRTPSQPPDQVEDAPPSPAGAAMDADGAAGAPPPQAVDTGATAPPAPVEVQPTPPSRGSATASPTPAAPAGGEVGAGAVPLPKPLPDVGPGTARESQPPASGK